jgi:hypothetical protein
MESKKEKGVKKINKKTNDVLTGIRKDEKYRQRGI